MKLYELINKMNENSCCEITISGLCNEYQGGVEELKKESWYKEARNCRVINFYICISGHSLPEINIEIERRKPE